MPYKSDAQRRYFNANREELEAEGVDVDEWNEASKGKDMPEKKAYAADTSFADDYDDTQLREALAERVRMIAQLRAHRDSLLDAQSGYMPEKSAVARLAKAAADISLVTVLDDDDNMLLIRRSKENTRSGMWENPLGHKDPGETDIQAARRELKEETGLTAKLLPKTTAVMTPDGKKQLRLYVGRVKGVKPDVSLAPEEHDKHRWVKPSSLGKIKKTNKDIVKNTKRLFDSNGVEIKVANWLKPLMQGAGNIFKRQIAPPVAAGAAGYVAAPAFQDIAGIESDMGREAQRLGTAAGAASLASPWLRQKMWSKNTLGKDLARLMKKNPQYSGFGLNEIKKLHPEIGKGIAPLRGTVTTGALLAAPTVLGGYSDAAKRMTETFERKLKENPEIVNPSYHVGQAIDKTLNSDRAKSTQKGLTDVAKHMGGSLAGSLGGSALGYGSGALLGSMLMPGESADYKELDEKGYRARRNRERMKSVLKLVGMYGGGIGGAMLGQKYLPGLMDKLTKQKQGSDMVTMIEKLARQAASEAEKEEKPKRDGDGDGKVNDGTSAEKKAPKKKPNTDKALGTVQGAYVADATGATSEERAADKITERFGDRNDLGAYDSLLTGLAPYSKQIHKRIRRGASRQAESGALRHLSNLDPTREGGTEGLVGLATGLGSKDTSDQEAVTAERYKKKIKSHQAKLSDPDGETTKRQTPWHLGMQGRFANLDSDVAGHAYHRKETPLSYWLNPLDKTGPFMELGNRAQRRMTAGGAEPEDTVGRFAMNAIPLASLIMGGEGAKQKIRRTADKNDIYAPEAKPDIKDLAKAAALSIPPELLAKMQAMGPSSTNALKTLGGALGGGTLGGLTGAGGAVGATVGGLKGLFSDPGEDEEGNKKSRLMAALKGTLGGGALGAAGGLAVGAGGLAGVGLGGAGGSSLAGLFHQKAGIDQLAKVSARACA